MKRYQRKMKRQSLSNAQIVLLTDYIKQQEEKVIQFSDNPFLVNMVNKQLITTRAVLVSQTVRPKSYDTSVIIRLAVLVPAAFLVYNNAWLSAVVCLSTAVALI